MHEQCVYHPDHAAIEHCEVCGRALCGLCLWYTEDGHRLCKVHAQEREAAGEAVLPPETYAEAIGSSLRRKPGAAEQGGDDNQVPYKGNSQDLTALLAVIIAVTTLFSCMGGAYCLPFAAVVLGLAAYTNAAQAVDPDRTRLLAGIGLGVSGLMVLFVMLYVLFFVGMMGFAVFAAAAGP